MRTRVWISKTNRAKHQKEHIRLGRSLGFLPMNRRFGSVVVRGTCFCGIRHPGLGELGIRSEPQYSSFPSTWRIVFVRALLKCWSSALRSPLTEVKHPVNTQRKSVKPYFCMQKKEVMPQRTNPMDFALSSTKSKTCYYAFDISDLTWTLSDSTP